MVTSDSNSVSILIQYEYDVDIEVSDCQVGISVESYDVTIEVS